MGSMAAFPKWKSVTAPTTSRIGIRLRSTLYFRSDSLPLNSSSDFVSPFSSALDPRAALWSIFEPEGACVRMCGPEGAGAAHVGMGENVGVGVDVGVHVCCVWQTNTSCRVMV
jgi:hypothetical protein